MVWVPSPLLWSRSSGGLRALCFQGSLPWVNPEAFGSSEAALQGRVTTLEAQAVLWLSPNRALSPNLPIAHLCGAPKGPVHLALTSGAKDAEFRDSFIPHKCPSNNRNHATHPNSGDNWEA